MHRLFTIRSMIAAGAFGASALSSVAQVLLGNLPWTGSHGNGLTISGSGEHAAVVFATPNTGYTVSSVVLTLNDYYGPAETTNVGFYTDNGSQPGTLVGGLLTQPAGAGYNGAPEANYTFVAGTTVTLQANTTYWMDVSSAGLIGWSYNPGGGNDPTGLATFVKFMYSSNGSSYSIVDPERSALQINATAIPEPSTYAAIFGVMALGLAAWRRRKSA